MEAKSFTNPCGNPFLLRLTDLLTRVTNRDAYTSKKWLNGYTILVLISKQFYSFFCLKQAEFAVTCVNQIQRRTKSHGDRIQLPSEVSYCTTRDENLYTKIYMMSGVSLLQGWTIQMHAHSVVNHLINVFVPKHLLFALHHACPKPWCNCVVREQ